MKEFRFHIKYILESIQMIKQYTENVSQEEFLKTEQLQDAIIRRLEVIGEAAKKMPDDFRKQYSNVPWRKMAAMRDVMAHDYMTLSMDVIWLTVVNDILPLESEIAEIIKKEL